MDQSVLAMKLCSAFFLFSFFFFVYLAQVSQANTLLKVIMLCRFQQLTFLVSARIYDIIIILLSSDIQFTCLRKTHIAIN